MERLGITYHSSEAVGTIVHVAEDEQYAGYLVISDILKPDAAQTITDLKKMGVKHTVMLTGDAKKTGAHIAGKLGIDEVYTELLPYGKIEKIEKLLARKSKKGTLVFVGDGINDAPVLARADVGVAMGGLGSDAAIEAADVVIMTDEPYKMTAALEIAKKTNRIARQNIIFALGVKAVVLILGAFGVVSMWAAVFADVGVSVIAILNAVRMLHENGNKKKTALLRRKQERA